jgi:hypothetical protein
MAAGIIVPFVGATFFASASKFTKEVGQAIRDYFTEWKHVNIERKLNELASFRSAVQRHKGECERFSLTRNQERSPTEKKLYECSKNAARNQLYAAKINCKGCWDFLERRSALPTNTLTRKPWNDFDEYLQAVHESEQRYA